jgi:ketosteroid isomerase-like protein
MSEENVAIVRSIWSADRRRDWSTVYAMYHPEIVWEDLAGLWGDWGRARGPEGVRVAWARWHEAFEGVEFDFGEVAHDGNVVVVTYRITAHGRGSGVEVNQDITLVWTLRDGRVVHITAYSARDEALAAAGLEG